MWKHRKKKQHAITKPKMSAITQMTFTPDQMAYLRQWFDTQKDQFKTAYFDDEFGGEEDDLDGLLGSLFTTGGFKTGEVASRERGEEKSGKRRTRRAKDPDAPKRPKSAFMIWQWDADHGVAKVKQDNPEIAHKEAVSRASEVWKSMSDEEKAPWLAKSEEAKEAYKSQMRDYNPNSGSEAEVEDEMDCPDGYELKRGMYLVGYGSSKTKYKTLNDAMDNIHDSDGGIVFDGKHYTIRKSGNPRTSTRGELLFLKQ